MQYFIEKANGERFPLAYTPDIPVEPAEQCNRLLLSGQFERIIATGMLTVLRLKNVKRQVDERLHYGGRHRGETKGHGVWKGA